MFFSPWYNSMLVIIFATALYQAVWLRHNGYKFKSKPTLSNRVLSLILTFIPILNTIFGLSCVFLLYVYAFEEERMLDMIKTSNRFTER